MTIVTNEQTAKILSNAAKASARYCARGQYSMAEDMKQEAVAVQLEAVGRYNPDGAPFGAYMWTATVRALKNHLICSQSPVTYKHRPDKLKAMSSVGLTYTSQAGEESDHSELPTTDTASELEARDRARRVRARLVHVLGETDAEYALRMFSHETTVYDDADTRGISTSEVYAKLKPLRDKLKNDTNLRSLWGELT